MKQGMRVLVHNAPPHFLDLLAPLPPAIDVIKTTRTKVDLLHIFCETREEYLTSLKKYRALMKEDGMLWISWPKKSSGRGSDLDENIIRDAALANGLVDVKVCAVDAVWSALKLVIPLAQRTTPLGKKH